MIRRPLRSSPSWREILPRSLQYLAIAHLHDDVMRALHSGSCSQRKTKWRLIAGAGSLAVFQGVLATVKQT